MILFFCGYVLHSWILPLYSIVTYMAALKTVDFIVEGIDRSKAVVIITTCQEEVCAALSGAFEQGMTILDGKGYYSDARKQIVYIVLNRFQIGRMTAISPSPRILSTARSPTVSLEMPCDRANWDSNLF